MKTVSKMLSKLLEDYIIANPDNIYFQNRIKDIQFAYDAQIALFKETEEKLNKKIGLAVKAGYCFALKDIIDSGNFEIDEKTKKDINEIIEGILKD